MYNSIQIQTFLTSIIPYPPTTQTWVELLLSNTRFIVQHKRFAGQHCANSFRQYDRLHFIVSMTNDHQFFKFVWQQLRSVGEPLATFSFQLSQRFNVFQGRHFASKVTNNSKNLVRRLCTAKVLWDMLLRSNLWAIQYSSAVWFASDCIYVVFLNVFYNICWVSI